MNAITRTFDIITDGFQALLSVFGNCVLAVTLFALRVCSVALQVGALMVAAAIIGTVLYLVYTFVLQDYIAALLPALPY